MTPPTPPRYEDVPLCLRTRIDIALVDAYNAAVQMGAPQSATRATPDPLPEKVGKRKHRKTEERAV